MRLRAASAVLAAVALAQVACDTRGEALVAVIQLEPGVPATCVSLTVTDPGTGRLLTETHVVRAAGQDRYQIALYRGPLPGEVVLQAQALAGTGCAAPLQAVSSSQPAQRAFQLTPVQVPLSIPRPALVPDALAFAPMSPVLYAGGCTAASVQPTARGSVAPVVVDTLVTFSISDAGLTAYTDGTCTAPATSATLPAGASALPLQLRGLVAGPYTVTAGADGLDAGSVDLDVLLTPATAVAFSSAGFTALSGACLGPVRLRAEDASGNPSLLSADASIGLSAVPGVTFFSDAQCASGVTSVVLAAGAPEAIFYFRSRTAGSITLRASAGALGNPTQGEQIVPTVRSGSCTLPLGITSLACAVGAPGVFDLSHAFLVVQAISNDDNPSGVNVRCRLADAGTIDCSRQGGTGFVDVQWQLVELPSGMRVQRVDNSLCSGTNLITLPQAVDPAKTFLLYTGEGSGVSVDPNDWRTVRLVSPTQVEVLDNADCGNALLDVQVVELEGASVDRGVLDAGYVPSFGVTTAAAVDLTRTFLLHSARFTGGSTLCGFQLRGQLTTPTTIDFTRGDGNDATCASPDVTAVSWERVQLPAGATSQQVVVALADGEGATTSTISPVDPARSFAFASGLFNAGAAFGETSFNGDDQPGAAGARFDLATGSRLEIVRAVDAGTARFTSYVVELP